MNTQAACLPAVGYFELKRTYKMDNGEKKFVASLPLPNAIDEINYTAAQKKKLQDICNRLASMNKHTEWHWMLKGANTTDQKYTKARAMHIYLNGVMDFKWELSPWEAACEFASALNMSHIWYRQLLVNAYEMMI